MRIFVSFLKNLVCLFFWLLFGCENTPEKNGQRYTNELKYAANFRFSKVANGIHLTILQPYKGGDPVHYLLTNSPGATASGYEQVINLPVKTLAGTSTSQIGFLDLLNAGEKLKGFTTTNFISSGKIRSLVESGKVAELGKDSDINLERLIELKPDLLLAYSISGDFSQWNKIRKLGIPILFDASYLEDSPLAQAEWIKLYGLLMDKMGRADSVFLEVEQNYLATANLIYSVGIKPKVICGSMYNGTWFMPGGKSWVAQYIADASGEYLWKNIPRTGSVPLSFESVYEKGLAADYWIGATAYQSISHLLIEDDRYDKLKCVRDKNIYSPTKKVNPLGGNDYYESGIARPDLVLKDFIKILHPEKLPMHELIYYQRLN